MTNPEPSIELESQPTIESTTSTTIDIRKEAGSYYIEIATPLNCMRQLYLLNYEAAGTEFEAQDFPGTASGFQEAYEFYRTRILINAEKLSEEMLTFASNLGTYSWPEGVQPSVDELIEDVLREAESVAAYSKLSSWQEIVDWEWPARSNRNPAGVIRAKLGLDSNVNDDSSYCSELIG